MFIDIQQPHYILLISLSIMTYTRTIPPPPSMENKFYKKGEALLLTPIQSIMLAMALETTSINSAASEWSYRKMKKQ